MRRLIGGIALVLALAPAGVPGALAKEPSELAARIDAYVEPYVAAEHLSGSILVAKGGETLYANSFGFANRELGVANTASTRFCVASITKPMTQIISLRLAEGGALGLEDKLSKWIPSFPRADEITVQMLARHTAGIPHRVTTDLEETIPRTAADMVELASAQELLFAPGSDSTYSSGGYAVLARVLELASGKSYSELLEEHVFGPAGLEHSQHPDGWALIPARASSYQFAADGAIVNGPLKHYSFLVGAGSVFSTPGDLVKVMRGVVTGAYGEVVKSQFVREGGLSWNGRTDGYRVAAPEPDKDPGG